MAPSRSDRVLAGSLTWLLVLTWSSGVLVAALALGGVSTANGSVKWWAAVLAVIGVVGTGVPLIRWLRPAVETVLFSHPEDARVLISQFGRQAHDLAGGVSERGLAEQIAEQIAGRLRLPYVAITEPGADPPPGPSGAPPDHDRLVRIELTFADTDVGTLLVLPRPRDARLPAPDRALLDDLAVQIGITLHAARATDDLRVSRAAVITAREEERRRIRRDLHDGLGPSLASLRLHLAALERLIGTDPSAATGLVERLRAEVRDTSAQVRGLVYDLRPPMLDEFGLAGAIRSRAESLGELDVVLDLGDVPDLPAAVEVALYRIVSEALQNVVRHAAADRAWVRLALTAGGTVDLEIADDGHGLPAPLLPGVGMAGMRERATELRGSFAVQPRESGSGTRVLVTLPLGRIE